jgi:hypothetical protein
MLRFTSGAPEASAAARACARVKYCRRPHRGRLQLPAGFEYLHLRQGRDAHEADAIVGHRSDQAGHGRAVAQRAGRGMLGHEGMGAHDASPQIRVAGVHRGIDQRHLQSRPLGALVRARDAERGEVGLQVVERVVVGDSRRGRLGQCVEFLQRLRQKHAAVLGECSEHVGHRPPVGDLKHDAVHRQRLDGPARDRAQRVRLGDPTRLLLGALRDTVAEATVAVAGAARRRRGAVRGIGERDHDARCRFGRRCRGCRGCHRRRRRIRTRRPRETGDKY